MIVTSEVARVYRPWRDTPRNREIIRLWNSGESGAIIGGRVGLSGKRVLAIVAAYREEGGVAVPHSHGRPCSPEKAAKLSRALNAYWGSRRIVEGASA